MLSQETYPSTPPVWFAESEETSITNAVQVLSNTVGQNNHVLNQVDILLRELCRLHNVSLPNDVEHLVLPQEAPHDFLLNNAQPSATIEDSDPEEIEDAIGESEQESEGDEDLPLEMDDGRNANKVRQKR